MAQAQITLKMNPIEFQVFQEAMLQYLGNLDGDDQGTRYRKSYAQGMLSGMGVGVMPDIKRNGQLGFDERGRVYGYQPDLDEEDEEPTVAWTDFEAGLNANTLEKEEAPEAETQAETEEVAEVAPVEVVTIEMQEAEEVA